MKNQATTGNPSTFQEIASFLNILNGVKSQDSPLLKKTNSPDKMVMHLERQFSQAQNNVVFYRLEKRQLSLNFS